MWLWKLVRGDLGSRLGVILPQTDLKSQRANPARAGSSSPRIRRNYNPNPRIRTPAITGRRLPARGKTTGFLNIALCRSIHIHSVGTRYQTFMRLFWIRPGRGRVHGSWSSSAVSKSAIVEPEWEACACSRDLVGLVSANFALSCLLLNVCQDCLLHLG